MIELLADIKNQLVTLTDRVGLVEGALGRVGEYTAGKIEDISTQLETIDLSIGAVDDSIGLLDTSIGLVDSSISSLERAITLND